MKHVTLAFVFLALTRIAVAQNMHDVVVASGFDLLKTDNHQILGKAQLGLEGNYFVVRHFAVGAGAELWTEKHSSFVMGVRFYADEHFFARFRGLIGANDASAGVGYAHPIGKDWRVEGIGDLYFRGDFAVRVGVAYVIHTD